MLRGVRWFFLLFLVRMSEAHRKHEIETFSWQFLCMKNHNFMHFHCVVSWPWMEIISYLSFVPVDFDFPAIHPWLALKRAEIGKLIQYLFTADRWRSSIYFRCTKQLQMIFAYSLVIPRNNFYLRKWTKKYIFRPTKKKSYVGGDDEKNVKIVARWRKKSQWPKKFLLHLFGRISNKMYWCKDS
jgi:hypothetical protein